MSLEDALGAVDPQGVVNDLIRDQAPTLAQNDAIDPQMVLNRLIRKGMSDRQQRGQQRTLDQPTQSAPADFGSFGQTPDEIKSKPAVDFSQFGQEAAAEPAPQAPAPKPADSGSAWDYPIEAGKGFLEGGKNLGAGALKGWGAAAPVIAQQKLDALDKVNAPPADDSPEERAAYRVRRGAVHPKQDVIDQRRATLTESAQKPITEQPLYKAGEAIENFGKEALAPRPGFEPGKSWTRDIGAGFGSMVGGLATSFIPGAGPALAGTIFLGAGMGEAVEKAIKEGATEEQARKAAELGAIAGATDMVDMLLPMLGSTGKALGFVRRVGTRALYGALTEGGQEGVQQLIQNAIAKGIYKPDQDMLDDVPRSMAIGAIVGGVSSGGFAALDRQKETRIDTEGDTTRADTGPPGSPPGALPPPGSPASAAGAADAPKPFETKMAPGRRSRVEEAAAYHKEYTAEDIASWSDEKLKDYVNTKLGGGSAGEGNPDLILRNHGFAIDDIKAMSPEQKKAAIDELRKAAHGEDVEEAAKEGTREAPVEAKTADDVAKAADVAAKDYSPEQGEANNIQRGHVKWQGLDITIETPAGGVRRGTNPKTGEAWETQHSVPYGYIKGSLGADGDHVDVSMGPEPDSGHPIYVLDERDQETGKFRQHKSFIGFPSAQAAAQAYLGTSSKKAEHIGGMRALSVDEFKDWIRSGETKKPLSDAMGNNAPIYREKGKPGTKGKEAEQTAPGALAPDQPSAEPLSDILAQVRDLNDPKHPRAAVWLPASSVEHIQKLGVTDRQIIEGRPAIENFDGKGGVLIARDQAVADWARKQRDATGNIQGIVGRLTGAGDGKPADATMAVQQRDADGNVVRERGVRAGDVAATRKEFSAPGRTVNVVKIEDAIKRRADLTAAETAPEVTQEHHAAVEDALRARGIEPATMRPADLARAAEIHAQEGAPPDQAFIVAVTRGLIEDGHIPREAADKELGDAAKALLESREDVGGEPPAQAPGAATGRPAAAQADELNARGARPGAAVPGAEARGDARQAGAAVPAAQGPGRAAAGGAGGEGVAAGGRGAATATEPEAARASEAALIGVRAQSIPEHKVTAADNTSVKVVPVVVEAADLVTSSDPGYDASLQPRQRDRAASQAQIREIATRLDPERLGYSAEADRGAPIVGPDRMVESGNGRVAAIRAVYRTKSPNAQRYRDWLTQQGVDVAAFKEPVLVRQRVTDLSQDERQKFTVAANQAATLAMSAPERALADANHLTPDTLDLIAGNDLGAVENRPFIRAFTGAIPASERGSLTNAEGGLSAEGLTRAKNAVLARAYGDADIISRITESTDDDVKSISNALVAAAPTWARLRGDIEAGRVRRDLDLTPELMEAVKRTADLRGRGEKLDQYLAQNDAFDKLPGPVEGFMRWFYDPQGRKAAAAQRIADKLRFYAEQAAKVTDDPDLGLDMPKVGSDEIQRAASAKTEGVQQGRETRLRPGVEAGGPHAGRPGAGEGRTGPAERELRRGLAEDSLFERTPAGQQHVLPGAERISSAELAKRRAAEPLKAKAPQKAADQGLFGDQDRQADLVEQASKVDLKVNKPAESAKTGVVSAPHDAFPEKVSTAAVKPAPKPQIKRGPINPSLFDWEQSNERPDTENAGAKTLGGVSSGQGQGAQGGRPAQRGAAKRSSPGADRNRAPDEEQTLFGGRGEGGGAAAVHPAQAGGSSGRAGRGTGGNGAQVPGVHEGTAAAGRGLSPVKPHEAPSVPAINFRITDETELGKGAESVKFADNLAAIEVLKRIEIENRRATPAEQRALARYVGWGGLANAFRQPDTNEFKSDWKDRGEAVEGLLTADELRAARSSTRNAHYTSKTVIDAMWKAAEHLGFKGGLALENSVGTGNFLGLVPEKIAGQTRFIAVESDSITARIAKALYPQDTVLHSGFERVPLPDGEFVLSIGNPPFGSESLRFQGPDLHGLSIHNQFFLASLDALQPGGVHIAVVSRYLLDAQDSAAREKMAVKADLLGVIRLPDTAFKENARTEVVTDIVVMQRRTPSDEAAIQKLVDESKQGGKGDEAKAARAKARRALPSWINTTEVRDPLGGEAMRVNEYFSKHPDMVMGRLERSGTMRARDEVNVTLDKSENLADLLDQAVKKLPENVMDLGKDVVDRTIERYKTLSDSIKIALTGHETGHLEFNDQGKLTQISERETPGGEYEPVRRVVTPESPWSRQLMMDAKGQWYTLEPTLDAKGNKVKQGTRLVYERKTFPNNVVPAGMRLGEQRFQRLNEITRLRDLLRRQIVLETQDAKPEILERNRGQLAAAYKAFTEAHGLLNEPRTLALLNEMPDGPLLMSLESGFRPAVTNARSARTGQSVKKASARPAEIMSKRVIPKYEPATSAATPADAIAITLSERGRLDAERVAGLLGIPQDKVGEAIGSGDKPLAFLDPETKTWEPRNMYLSGQVRRKLAAARAAGLEKNVQELEAIQPERWTADRVTPMVGSNWIPPKHYADFARHLLGVDQATVHYSEPTNSFNMLVGDYGAAKQAEWGTPDMPADAILRGMLNSRIPKVIREERDGNGGTRRYNDKDASALVALKAKEIEGAFSDWVFKDGERRRELVDIYNDKFNTRSPRQHDGSHLMLPGKNPAIVLRRHVKNAIWRGIYERNMLVDHVVGAGKTFFAIARAMERRRMGLSRKPMVAVPNHLVEQWASEAYRLYPGIKILAAGKNQFTRQNRRKLFAKIATGDWDLVIVPHSSFGFIGISPETELRFLDEQLRVAQEAVKDAEEEAAASGLGGFRKPYTVKEAERLVTTIQTKMDTIRGNRRDKMLTFEQMGVDDLTVDEAHEFKNLFYSSRMTDVRGMGDRGGSQKAFDLYNKVKVLNESPTGTVTFLTGTPISNSAVEMYTMMRYLAANELRQLGMEHFDAWRSQFVSAEPKWEPTESGGIKEVTRLGRSWSNMRALMDLYRSFTDSVTQEDINRWYAEDNNGADFPIPKVEGGERKTHVVKPSPAQTAILQDVLAGFENLPNIADPDERNIERLKLMDRARKVSLDARAVDPRNPSKEEGGKLETISNEVARIYKKWNKDKGTQLIFLDRGVPKSRGDDKIIKAYDELVVKRDSALAAGDEEAFRRVADALDKFDPSEIAELRVAQAGGWNAYDQIKQNLIKHGIPADEIRFVQEANNDAEKKAMFDAANSGEIRVLIGSTQRMGAGTNVQERIVALHHGDVTWKPSDIEQREGRIIRQGNGLLDKYGKDFAVEIHNYVTERTVDGKMWDLNSEKLRMINGIRDYDGAFNMEFADEDSISMAEIAALASGDPMLMERVKLSGEIEKLEIQERGFRRKMNGIEDAIDAARRAIDDYPARIEATKAASDDMAARVRAMKHAVAARRVTVEGKQYDHNMVAMQAAFAEMDRQKGGDENAKYEVTIDGNKFTSKDAISAAIAARMGDQSPFEAKIGGETIGRRRAAAQAIADKIAQVEPMADGTTIKIGTMLGGALEATVHANGPEQIVVTLALTDGGRTLAAAQHGGTIDRKEISPQTIQSLIHNLEKDAGDVVSSRGAWMQDRVDAAKKALPDLLPQLKQTSPVADKLVELRERLRDVIQTLDARTRGDSALNDYVSQALASMQEHSRAAQGAIDVSSTPGKAEKLVDGLTPEVAAERARKNVKKVIRDLYAKRHTMPTDGLAMEKLVDDVAATIADGIVKPGELMRSADTKFPMQTAARDLEIAHRQFAEELASRLADPTADPVETAAWIEWRANVLDHFWADGSSKTSRALAAIPLMRAGLPLPKYPSMKEFVAPAAEQPRVDPRGGGAEYLGEPWNKFNAAYHELMPLGAAEGGPVFTKPSIGIADHEQLRAYIDAISESDLAAALARRAKKGLLPELHNRADVLASLEHDLVDIRSRPTTEALLNDPKRKAIQRWVVDVLDAQGGHATPGRDTPRRQERRIDLVLGPPAAGKSSHLVNPLLREHGALLSDADEAKILLEEFDEGRGAGAVHVESAHISENLLIERAIKRGDNIVQPLVGKNTKKIEGLIGDYTQLGYSVFVHYVDLPIDKAISRALTRYVETGRLLDSAYLQSVGDLPRRTFDTIKKRGDVHGYQAVSTDVPFGQPPILLEAGGALQGAGVGRRASGWDQQNPEAPDRREGGDGQGLAEGSLANFVDPEGARFIGQQILRKWVEDGQARAALRAITNSSQAKVALWDALRGLLSNAGHFWDPIGHGAVIDAVEHIRPHLLVSEANARKLLTDAARSLEALRDKVVASGFAENDNRFVAPPFYSAIVRAIENSKQEKAAPNHWLGMLKNTPGVKPEEMEWLGIADWLREHKGSVTKGEIADYVRANQVEVREVTKGGPLTATADEQAALMEHLARLEAAGDLGDPNAEIPGNATDLMEGALDGRADAIGNLEGLGVPDSLIAPFRDRERAPTKFNRPDLVLPGGENYRELLLTLPQKEMTPEANGKQWYETWTRRGGDPAWEALSPEKQQAFIEQARESGLKSQGDAFRSSHWDEPNVLAHVRFNDRTIDGKRALFIEEVQSDWHQKGRRGGYQGANVVTASSPMVAKDLDGTGRAWEVSTPDGKFITTVYTGTEAEAIAEARIRVAEHPERTGVGAAVPDAPFKTTWPELALKRMIRYAAENGYDKIAWTPGSVQADRYDLSKHIHLVQYTNKNYLYAFDHGGNEIISERNLTPEQLPDHIGKDVAEKLLAQTPGQITGTRELSGLDLKVGGEGMAGFYDKILPAAANKIGKKFGAKVGREELHTGATAADEIEIAHRGDHFDVIESDTGMLAERFASRAEAEAYIASEKPLKNQTTLAVHTLPITDALRNAAVGEGFALFEGNGRPFGRAALGIAGDRAGPLKPAPNVPVARQAQDYVVAHGKQTGVEHLVAVGGDGKIIATNQGTSTFVSVDGDLLKAVDDPRQSVVIHHNHPSNTGLSNTDISMLGSPGLSAVWAHGHDGNVARMALTPEAKARFARLGTAKEVRSGLFRIANTITGSVYDTIQRAILDNRITMAEAQAVMPHAVALAMQRGGLVDYRTNANLTHLIDKLGLEPYINRAARAAAGVLNVPGFPVSSHDRPTEPLRHLGDVGATFERSREPAGFDREQARPDRVRKGLDRAEAAGQIRLPGFAENGPQFRASTGTAGGTGSAIRLPTEVIADHLEARNLPRLASISSAVGIGKFNTTEARVQLQDKFIRWKHMQGASEQATGQATPETRDVYLIESLYYGRAGERLEKLDKEHIDPLITEIKRRGLTLENVNKFLMARHAPERNAELRKINHPPLGTMRPDVPNPSGMSDAEARAIIAGVDRGGKRADYDAVEARVRALIDETRTTLVNGGLISDSTADAWARTYKNYVPLRGFADDTETEAPRANTGKGFDVRGPESKRALGRKSLADSPLAYTFLQAQQAVIRAEKARVGRAALRFVRANPMPDLWQIDKGETKRTISKTTGLVTEIEDPMWRLKPNAFAMKVHGEPYYINFKGDYGENLARALKNLGMANMHPVLRFIANLTRLQARLATSWNPDFLIPNFTRDIGEAFINMQGEKQKQFTKQFVKHLFPAIPGSFQALTGRTGGRYADAFREFDEAGGRIRFFGMEDVEDIKAAVASKMRRLQGGTINNLRTAAEKATEAIDIANGTIENATRLASFMAAKDVGMSSAKAASIAREMTVNFNRKGELGAAISGLYMFANAAMQGQMRMAAAMKNSKAVRRGAYALAAMGAALTLYNILMGGDDKDGEPYYMKIAPWTRGTNLILMWPKGFGHDGQHVKIPLPYGYSFFHVIGSESMSTALQKQKPSKAAASIASSVLDAFDPLGKDENLLAQFAPSIVRPVVHLATNQNWTGRPINPQVEPWNKSDPDASRYFRSASPFSVSAAGKINEWTGGNKHKPGMVDWSPGSIDYMLGFVTGGLGRFLMNANTTAVNAARGTEWQMEKTPIIRRFYGQPEPAADRARYFEEREAVRNAWGRLKGYEKDKDQQNARILRQESQPEIAAHSSFDATDKQRTGILKKIDAIRTDASLSHVERERQIKAKEQEELDLMLRARQRLQELRKNAKTPPLTLPAAP